MAAAAAEVVVVSDDDETEVVPKPKKKAAPTESKSEIVFYLLDSIAFPDASYMGKSTRGLDKRLEEHNAGRKKTSYTYKLRPLRPVAYVTGFQTNLQVCQFEIACKRRVVAAGDCRTKIHRAIKRIMGVMFQEKWMEHSEPAAGVPLVLHVCSTYAPLVEKRWIDALPSHVAVHLHKLHN